MAVSCILGLQRLIFYKLKQLFYLNTHHLLTTSTKCAEEQNTDYSKLAYLMSKGSCWNIAISVYGKGTYLGQTFYY